MGYTLEILRDHLEKKFEVGMSWDNYGKGVGKWSIDHIRPLASFSFTSYEDPDFKECWSLDNIRPLWDSLNSQKNSFYNGHRYQKPIREA